MKKSLMGSSVGSFAVVCLLAPAALAGRGDPCSANADCGEHYVCSKDETDVAGAGSCDSEGNCTTEIVESPQPTEGICVGEPIRCTASSSCPTASVCLEGVCAFELVSCQDDAACPAGYQCFADEASKTCASQPCLSGQECPEPVCETSHDAFCLPAPVACTSGSSCEGDDICYDIPNEGAPEGYAELDFACWPPGLVGVAEGYVAAAQDGSLMGSSAADSTSGTGSGAVIQKSSEDGASGDGEARGDDGAGADNEASDGPDLKGQSSGCTVGAPGPAPSGPSGLAALALMAGLTLLRRRG